MARLIGTIVKTWTHTRAKKQHRGIKRVLWPLARILICAYAGFAGILLVFQSRLLYLPHKELESTPREVGLDYQDVSFTTTDGVKLHGWFVPAGQNSRGVVLFCHGNAGNISHRLQSIHIFNRLNMDVFIFDYRGYGRSEATPSEQGTYLDAEAAWSHLTQLRNIPAEKIVIFGRSLGGAIAAHLAQDHTPGAVIIESSFTSVPDIAAKMYPFMPVRLLCRFDYNTLESVQQLDCPMLVVHSRADEMIPFDHGRRIFEAAKEPKSFLEINGSHNDGFLLTPEAYLQTLERFLTKHL